MGRGVGPLSVGVDANAGVTMISGCEVALGSGVMVGSGVLVFVGIARAVWVYPIWSVAATCRTISFMSIVGAGDSGDPHALREITKTALRSKSGK